MKGKHWEVRPLGEIIALNYGKALEPEHRSPSGAYPVYGANGIKDWSDRYLSKGPSIIIGRKGSAGEIALAEGNFWPLDVTYFVSFDSSLYDLKFLYYLLSNQRLPSLARGVKPGINRNDVYALKVAVPLLEEQKRIVAILDEAFEGLARARENATANIENAKQVFDSFLFRIFQLQEGEWVVEDLNTNVRFVDYRGKTPPKRETGVRLITAKNVKFGYIQRHPEEFIDENAYETWMSRGYPKLGDVLFTTEAPLANVAQLDTSERVVIGQRLITMQTNEKVLLPAFLKFALMSPQMNKAIRDRGTGATVQGIKASLLKKVPLAYPKSLHLQAEIASKCDEAFSSMHALVDLQFERRESLDTLRQSLLHKAFSGQLT